MSLLDVPEEQIIKRIQFDNPWWSTGKIDKYYELMQPRLYHNIFHSLVLENVKRAVVLMGPRRVGKTVSLFHTIKGLINSGINPRKICYLSIETPLFNNIGLDQLFELCRKAVNDDNWDGYYVFFDEIQYLKDWEVHLKSLVDSYHNTKFIASGSAAAALKLKSNESGAGRFTDFLLPPLTFCEFIDLKGLNNLIYTNSNDDGKYSTTDIKELNLQFIDYINYGGYPEVIFSEEIQKNPQRYIRNDIVDKVLLRDLPSLYGINNVQELNSLFTSIAYNTGNEISYESLSQKSGILKETIKRYLAYLEAAFLIKPVHKIDQVGNKLKRETAFKIYLTNPSLRSALFSPLNGEDGFMGNMVETAIFAQYFYKLYYARWANGEVDLVGLDRLFLKPIFAAEIKWSNSFFENPYELKSFIKFCSTANPLSKLVTTIDKEGKKEIDGMEIEFMPASLYCYTLGKNAVGGKMNPADFWLPEKKQKEK